MEVGPCLYLSLLLPAVVGIFPYQRIHILLVFNEWTMSRVGPCLTARGSAVSTRCGFLCVFHGLLSRVPGIDKLSADPRVGQGLVFVRALICHIFAMCACHVLFDLFTLSVLWIKFFSLCVVVVILVWSLEKPPPSPK